MEGGDRFFWVRYVDDVNLRSAYVERRLLSYFGWPNCLNLSRQDQLMNTERLCVGIRLIRVCIKSIFCVSGSHNDFLESLGEVRKKAIITSVKGF